MLKKILDFLDRYSFYSQLILISSSFLLLAIGMDICFFYSLLESEIAIISILYQLALKIFIIYPLVYIILIQKEKIAKLEDSVERKNKQI